MSAQDSSGARSRPAMPEGAAASPQPSCEAPPPDGEGGFELYDLRVEVVAPPGATLWCNARPGDWFELRGELLFLPPGQGFSIYSIAAVLPLLAAKQRATAAADWMTSDSEVACPDPHCPSRLRITRLGRRSFRHGDTTAVPLPHEERDTR